MIRLLQVSAVATLLALALMVWSMLAPTPLPVMLAMTVGQGLGMLALGAYVFVVIKDLRRAMRAKRDSLLPPFKTDRIKVDPVTKEPIAKDPISKDPA
ncbi:MAG: hypothetical protein IPQ07_15580 [Myxococcales bacterium]|nr:hypothetical protein [Myxococcales bacterium]